MAMNSIVVKWMSLGIGMLVTIGLITYGVTQARNVRPIQNQVNEQQLTRAQMIEQQQYAAYDNYSVTGSALITAMRKYSDKPNFSIYIKKLVAPGSGSYYYFWMNPNNDSAPSAPNFDFNNMVQTSGTFSAGAKITIDQAKTPGTLYYVAPSSRYQAVLVKKGARVVGVAFEEK